MKMLKSFGQLAVFAALLVMSGVAPVSAEDLWTVSNVQVDATGTSPSTAKDAAMGQGRQIAWTQLFRRMTPANEWARQPQLASNELELLVKSFDVANERHSSTRYLATVTFRFNPITVRSALRKTGVQYSESIAKPVLVIPLIANAWVPDSAWSQAWSATARVGSLVPIVVPVGDVAEMQLLSGAAGATDWATMKSLADRYNAGAILVANASRTAGGLEVSLTQIKPEGRSQRGASYASQAKEDDLSLSTRAATTIADSVQEDWKRSTSVDYGAQTSLMANVAFSSLGEWVGIKKDLDSVRLIQNILVDELNLQGARLRFDYVGRVEQLQTALAQENLFLTPDANGTYILSRSAGAAPSPAPAAVP
ncbi:MAG: DUF2066 domain-containing protein [Alphaproteobacteria bacterium]|nr:DUF2066 domain-containing protein [Alphaproteobacteria bacterium]